MSQKVEKVHHQELARAVSATVSRLTILFFSVNSSVTTFSHIMTACLKKLMASPKIKSYIPLAILGPMATIWDFTGSEVLQAVSNCPLRC